MENKSIIASAILACGIVCGGLAIMKGLTDMNSKRTVSVKGLSEKEVMADHVIWPIVYDENGNDLADIYSSIAASVLSLKGSRHGGANLRVMRQMDEIKRNVKNWRKPAEVKKYLNLIAEKKAGDGTGLIYGLGHAVYTISDPRAQMLKAKAEALAKEKGRVAEMKLFELIESEGPKIIKRRHPNAQDVCANVDLYSGFVYDMLGIPKDLYTPLFAVARCVSWCAHRMEELVNNGPIIRPAYKPLFHPRNYVKLADR